MAQQSKGGGGKFSCAACGKQYSWKPQLAGKKAKCACGAALVVPMAESAAPARPPRPSVEDDPCEFALSPAPQQPARVSVPMMRVQAPTSTAAGALPYATPAGADPAAKRRREREAQIHDVRRDLYLPLGLILAGFMGMLAWAVFAADAGGAGVVLVSIAAFISTLVKTICIIALALVAAPMLGISFGDFRTAIAKFAAVIIFTDMGLLWLGEIIESVAPRSGGRAPRGSGIVTILFATATISILVRFLFDMDNEETGYVALPLAIASLVIGFVLKVVAVGVLMGLAAAAKGGSSAGKSGAPATPVVSAAPAPVPAASDAAAPAAAEQKGAPEGSSAAAAAAATSPAEETIEYKETPQDREVAAKLRSPLVKEARRFLASQALPDEHQVQFIGMLHAAGARKVYYDLSRGVSQPAIGYVELPAQPSRRAGCIRVYQAYCGRNRIEPDPESLKDTGQRFLVMQLRK